MPVAQLFPIDVSKMSATEIVWTHQHIMADRRLLPTLFQYFFESPYGKVSPRKLRSIRRRFLRYAGVANCSLSQVEAAMRFPDSWAGLQPEPVYSIARESIEELDGLAHLGESTVTFHSVPPPEPFTISTPYI